MSTEVHALVNRCLAGQQSAFTELIRQYQGLVYGLCLRMLGQREEAEDATQETFLRVCNSLHQWDSTRAFEPWLITIAGNRCRTRLAKRMRRPGQVSLDYPVEDASHLEFEAKHLAEEIELALNSIQSPDCKAAFLMFHKQGAPYLEIAKQLNVPLGTVKTWVHRARKELIEKLKNRGTLHVRH